MLMMPNKLIVLVLTYITSNYLFRKIYDDTISRRQTTVSNLINKVN